MNEHDIDFENRLKLISAQLVEEKLSANSQEYHLLFEDIFERYKRRIFSYIRRELYCKQFEHYEDIFQQTFLNAHKGFLKVKFRDEKHFKNWLYKVAFNQVRNANRSTKKRNGAKLLSLDSRTERNDKNSVPLDVGHQGIQAAWIAATEVFRKAKECLSSLNTPTYDSYALLQEIRERGGKDFAGLAEELAELEGREVTADAVKMRWQRVKNHMAKHCPGVLARFTKIWEGPKG